MSIWEWIKKNILPTPVTLRLPEYINRAWTSALKYVSKKVKLGG